MDIKYKKQKLTVLKAQVQAAQEELEKMLDYVYELETEILDEEDTKMGWRKKVKEIFSDLIEERIA